MTWRLAPSLDVYRRWVYATWPKHPHNLDGTIGDAAHQATDSDHNPNVRGMVDAFDLNETGVHMPTALVAAMVHPSTHYVIYEGRIYKARNLFAGEAYRGTSDHATHGHISTWQTVKAEQSKTPWGVTHWGTLINGSTGRAVSELQAYLNLYGASLSVDGHFGDAVEAAVRAYQHRFNVAGGADGIVGVNTQHSMKTNPYHRM